MTFSLKLVVGEINFFSVTELTDDFPPTGKPKQATGHKLKTEPVLAKGHSSGNLTGTHSD
jgi:hypothetical protein